jgi:hypothetical protein
VAFLNAIKSAPTNEDSEATSVWANAPQEL